MTPLTAKELFYAIEKAGPGNSGNSDYTALLASLRHDNLMERYQKQEDFRSKFGYAVPSLFAIEKIRDFVGGATILEIGAGLGLWACLLQKHGVLVTPTDLHVGGDAALPTMEYPPLKGQTAWTYIHNIPSPLSVTKVPADVLMSIWPCYNRDWPTKTLKKFKGTQIVYVGEGHGGCTGNDEFHEILAREFEEKDCIDIPQWFGLHDRLYLYERKDWRVDLNTEI